jgi:hypothetical protein
MASAAQQSARDKFLAMIAAKKKGAKKVSAQGSKAGKQAAKKMTRAEVLAQLAAAKKGGKKA